MEAPPKRSLNSWNLLRNLNLWHELRWSGRSKVGSVSHGKGTSATPRGLFFSDSQGRMNLSICSINFNKSMAIYCKANVISAVLPTNRYLPNCRHLPCVSLSSIYCIPLSIYSSTHASIIPHINHETDGLSGVLVRTDGFPLPRPYHYLPSFHQHPQNPT